MLRFVEIAVGAGSPLSCVRCAAPLPADYSPLSILTPQIEAAAGRWTTGPGPNILLVGPEPFAHPELPALVGVCVRAGVERIGIETDGGALAAHGNAAGALSAGVTNIIVRVLAADDDRSAAMTGRPGLARQVAEGVRAYRGAAERTGAHVAITAAVPVCRHNVEHLPSTVAELARWDLDAVRLTSASSANSAGGVSALVAAACDTGMVNRLWVEVEPSLPLPDTHALHRVETGAGDE